MTETTEARVAPAADGPQLTEQINFLVTPETRAFLLGSLAIDNARSEGTVARQLLLEGITRFRDLYPTQYDRRIQAGEAELARRK